MVLSGGISAGELPPSGRRLSPSAAMPSVMCIQIQAPYRYRQTGNHLYLISSLGYSLLSESV